MADKDQKETEGTQNIEKLSKERDDFLAGWQRAKADLINYKKDELKRLEEVARFANAEIIFDIIRVLDSFELGLTAMEKLGKVDKGVYLIKGQLEDALRKYGLERVEVKEGDEFDPNLQEAIASIDGNVSQDNRIAEEVERGYTLHGRTLRVPKVKVYKKKT
ncbi:MAG: nucleotide exchange factor GrpE [Candidatus Colwellbacteria bacterium]|nr:nucleotide exchange factor GrpE [Candidatus Colwellbacteria bacterium]